MIYAGRSGLRIQIQAESGGISDGPSSASTKKLGLRDDIKTSLSIAKLCYG